MELVPEDFLNAQKEMKEELTEMRKRQEQIDSGLEISNSKLNEEIKKRKKSYLGRFWLGCAGKAKRGLEISGIGVMDLDLHTCLHLEAVQTLAPSTLETV